MAITVSIASVDRTDKLKINTLRISRNLNGGSKGASLSCVLEELGTGYKPAKGNVLTVLEGSDKRFSGNIWRVVSRRHPGPSATDRRQYAIEAKGFASRLDRRLYTADIEAGKTLYEVVLGIFNQVLDPEGFTINNVANPGYTFTEALRFYYEPVSQVLNKLSTISGLFWYVDFDKDLHFSTFASNPAPFSITDSSANWLERVAEDFEVDEDDADYRNRQHERTEAGMARSITETIDLDLFAPQTQAVIKDVQLLQINGVDKTFYFLDSTAPGFTNPTSGRDFWINKNDFGIFPLDYTIQAGDVLTIQYTGVYSQSVITVDDYAEQASRASAEGDSGIWEAIEEQRNIAVPITLQGIAEGRLRQFGGDAVKIRFKLQDLNHDSCPEPGQRVTVTRSVFGINASYLIETVDSNFIATGNDQTQDDFFEHSVQTTSNEPFGVPVEKMDKLIEMASIGPPQGDAGASGETTAGEEEYFIWHIRGALATGKNSTNHHELKRDCIAFDVLASTADGSPTSNMQANFTYTDPDTTTATVLAGSGVVIASGQLRSSAVTFPSPQVVMKERGFVELNVTATGGASNVMFLMRAR